MSKLKNWVSLVLILSCFGCIQQKRPLMTGIWELDQDKSITLKFRKDSLFTFKSDSLIFSEKYLLRKSSRKETELLTINETDTIYQKIMGLTDSTLTLMTKTQGKINFYQRK